VTAQPFAQNHNSKYGLTPRVKHACRLYASAAVSTKKEAAEAVGLNPSYFNVITQPGHAKAMPEAIALIDEIQQKIEDKAVDLSSVVQLVSREALVEVRNLMKDSKNEAIKLKAASDILDRNPETSKTQKIQATSFSLSGEDAKQLAAALVLSAQAQSQIPPVTGDFVRIPIDKSEEEFEDAGQRLLSAALGQVDQVRELSAQGRGAETDGGTVNLPAGQTREGPAPQEHAQQGPVIRLVKADDS
jgi:hypothetical protein